MPEEEVNCGPEKQAARKAANQVSHIRALAKKFPKRSLQSLLISEALKEALAREKRNGETPAREIAAKAVQQAIEGDDRARAFVADRVDGPVKQNITVEFSGESLAVLDLAIDTVAEIFGDDLRVEEWLSLFQKRASALRATGSLSAAGSASKPEG